jgi:uncharacterized protein YndB with AHSA1/START domain
MTPGADERAVRLERTIPAPPHRVYRAWLEPELLRRWLAPAGYTTTRVEVDERVGGHHRTWHDDGDGAAGGFDCELLELVPDRRLVFRWRFVGPDRIADPTHDSRLTITLAEAPGGATALTLLHERLAAVDAARPGMAEGARRGWEQALEHLVDEMEDG